MLLSCIFTSTKSLNFNTKPEENLKIMILPNNRLSTASCSFDIDQNLLDIYSHSARNM